MDSDPDGAARPDDGRAEAALAALLGRQPRTSTHPPTAPTAAAHPKGADPAGANPAGPAGLQPSRIPTDPPPV